MSGAHIVVGTAGHVDHGKTLLTKALTGVDTDRLPEEKKRGMTIVPGFVPLDLASGRRLGLIDVPGHERFIKNMLAGVSGIDMALLVIAADEGVMPQTVEHLHILDLLGIGKGVVAITKCDLVDKEWLEMVYGQVEALLAPTGLRDAPVIHVCARTGLHIGELAALLDQVAATVQERPSSGLCRMPVDRAFTKQGFGMIVTGTLWSGNIGNGQRLQLLPGGEELRVRGLQVHGRPVQRAQGGQRTAVNLAGPGAEKAKSGCWLAEPGLLRECYRLDIELGLLSDAPTLNQRMRLRVFHGTMEVLARVRLLDRAALEPGQSCLCQLELESPLFPFRGDRIILRACSPTTTIAGATVLHVAPPRYRPSDPKRMDAIKRHKAGLDTSVTLQNILQEQDAIISLPALAEAAQLPKAEAGTAVAALVSAGLGICLPVDGAPHYCCASLERSWRRQILRLLEEYHGKYPLRRGMPAPELRQRVFGSRINAKQLSALLSRYAAEGLVTLQGSLVARAAFACTPTPEQKAHLDAILGIYNSEKFTPPDWNSVISGMGVPTAQGAEYLTWLLDNNKLTKVGGLLFTASAVREAEEALRAAFSTFTMAEARDLLGSSRKYILALLEYFDAQKRTVREGDSRRFLK